jgi:hypothetical protein
MSSVVPMKLVPVSDMSNQDGDKFELPTLSTSSVIIDNKLKNGINNKVGDISNLDKELLEILHNNDLTEDAKARLYWVSLHKAEIYKDKSMWTEPVIVELRENRFIPVPVYKSSNGQLPATTTDGDDNITFDRSRANIQYSNKRKRIVDETEAEDAGLIKKTRPDNYQTRWRQAQIPAKISTRQPLQILPTPQRVPTKRKLVPDTESEDNDLMLKRMAKINRIQANITQDDFDKNVKIGEPLVVFDTQDQPIPSTTVGPTATPAAGVLPTQQQQPPDIDLPLWMRRFFRSLNKLPVDTQIKIKDLVISIWEEDSNFQITPTTMFTLKNTFQIKTNPVTFLSSYVKGLRFPTTVAQTFYGYLDTLGISMQVGSGNKKVIRKWVKL